jgi:hypothetical protein
VRERGDQRRQRRLAGGAGHRRAARVDGVHPGVDRGEQRGELAAGGVVGVQVHRQVEALRSARTSGARPRARSSPAMSLIASTCAPASTIRSASRR